MDTIQTDALENLITDSILSVLLCDNNVIPTNDNDEGTDENYDESLMSEDEEEENFENRNYDNLVDIWTMQTVFSEDDSNTISFINTINGNEYIINVEQHYVPPRNLFLVTNKNTNEIPPIINEDCCICLDKLHTEDGKQISQIEECHHGFCGDCLFNWLKNHNVCPVCRTPCTTINLCN
ncbi:hypothetical protein KM622_gp073 [Spodoptera exempta nucleopolyhedrovirus]|uniref:RING-type domain-containing protein n=1 Tax=Spodoptera exempta nucleopolyhedrovirus TaxID=1242863 RepID=A0A410S7S9_9ABAC|nr:hypothetical protein KM622_gp073 [Spodoptera exempta nucleopolyhedrovirus]QAT90359.1 hypothetical protein [Spodoptera exempta nucleopolyhedrovirus]